MSTRKKLMISALAIVAITIVVSAIILITRPKQDAPIQKGEPQVFNSIENETVSSKNWSTMLFTYPANWKKSPIQGVNYRFEPSQANNKEGYVEAGYLATSASDVASLAKLKDNQAKFDYLLKLFPTYTADTKENIEIFGNPALKVTGKVAGVTYQMVYILAEKSNIYISFVGENSETFGDTIDTLIVQ